VLTVILAIAKYLPRGTRVGLLANLDASSDMSDKDDEMMVGMVFGVDKRTPIVFRSTTQVYRARWHSVSPRPP
jgi:hypothetical protein